MDIAFQFLSNFMFHGWPRLNMVDHVNFDKHHNAMGNNGQNIVKHDQTMVKYGKLWPNMVKLWLPMFDEMKLMDVAMQ